MCYRGWCYFGQCIRGERRSIDGLRRRKDNVPRVYPINMKKCIHTGMKYIYKRIVWYGVFLGYALAMTKTSELHPKRVKLTRRQEHITVSLASLVQAVVEVCLFHWIYK